MLQITRPRTVRTVVELRDIVRDWRRAGDLVALTPTMGGLHEGHLSLVRAARRRARRVVATIFVNPTQFGRGEDFDAYPKDDVRDAELLASAGCDLIYAPSVEEMYPEGFSSTVSVAATTDTLCGSHRPGHFDGVTTVVCKLLNQTQPDYAIFGEKDWQQLVTIRRMVHDLDIPVRISSSPTVREADGLAMSSRNRYLTPAQRRIAAKFNKALFASADHIAHGLPIDRVTDACGKALLSAGFDSIDYLEARDAYTLQPVDGFQPGTEIRLFAAARLGTTRLIDNVPVERTGMTE